MPDLATSLPAPSDDGQTYTFHVRDGVEYSNGRKVTALDFRTAIERRFGVAARPLRSTGASRRGGVHSRGVQPVHRHQGRRRRGDGDVQAHAPDPAFLYKLALPEAAAVHDVDAAAPVPATGPYEIAEATDDGIVLKHNEHFHVWTDEAQPDGYPDRITWRSAGPQAEPAVEQQQADIVHIGVPASLKQLNDLSSISPDRLHVYPSNQVWYLFMTAQLPAVHGAGGSRSTATARR